MNKMTTKNSKGIFPQEWFKKKNKTIIKPNVESQRTLNNHTNFEKKGTKLELLYCMISQSHSNKNCMVWMLKIDTME